METNLKWEIINPSIAFIDDLARFNTEMAWETEQKKLVPETITLGVKHLIEQPKYGSYLIAIHNGKAVGCLLLTFEYHNQLASQIYWIQSVYVEPDFRGKGIFNSLFKKAIEEARNNHSYSVKLYVEKTNERAKKVYSKLGMSNNNQEIFEIDFSFGGTGLILPESTHTKDIQAIKLNEKILDQLSEVKTKHLIGTHNQDALNLEGLAKILKQDVSGSVVVIKQAEKILGVVSAFSEWSDWRDKVTQWIYDVKVSDQIDTKEQSKYLQIFLKMAFDELNKDPMGAYRVNFKDSTLELKQALLQIGLEESHYYIYEIITS